MPMSAGAAATAPTSWCSASTSGRVASERRSRWSPDRRAADEPWDRPPPAAASSVRPAGVGYHRRAGRPRSVGGRTSAASPRRSSAASRRFALSISRSPLNWETVAAPTSGNRSTSRSVSRSAGVSARIGLPDVRVSGGSGMVVMPPPPPAARRRAASCPYRRGLRSRGSDDRSARPAAGLSVPRA